MICSQCTKLLNKQKQKKCMKCNNTISYTLTILCEECSLKTKQCSICLKKIMDNTNTKDCGCGKR